MTGYSIEFCEARRMLRYRVRIETFNKVYFANCWTLRGAKRYIENSKKADAKDRWASVP